MKGKKVDKRIVLLVSVVLLVFAVAFLKPSYFRFPAGQFTRSIDADACSFEGVFMVGVGETLDIAQKNLESRKVDYAHLYCNGKFKDDPDGFAIQGFGCMVCKPDCTPEIELLGQAIQGEANDGRIMLKQYAKINC